MVVGGLRPVAKIGRHAPRTSWGLMRAPFGGKPRNLLTSITLTLRCSGSGVEYAPGAQLPTEGARNGQEGSRPQRLAEQRGSIALRCATPTRRPRT